MRLILGTGNVHKAQEFARLISLDGIELVRLDQVPAAIEIDEVGATLAENATRKAVVQARHLCQWVLADDTGLFVDALGGEPGVRSARWAGERATAAENRHKLLEGLAQATPKNRAAKFVCELALADPEGSLRAASVGECCGWITYHPRGDLTFGYDPVFEVLEYHRTFAELGAAAKDLLSHRSRAVQKLWPALAELSERRNA